MLEIDLYIKISGIYDFVIETFKKIVMDDV